MYVPNEVIDIILKAGSRDAAIEALADYDDMIADYWSIRDVPDMVQDDDLYREVLACMEHYHDCNIGYNWGTMNQATDRVLERHGL